MKLSPERFSFTFYITLSGAIIFSVLGAMIIIKNSKDIKKRILSSALFCLSVALFLSVVYASISDPALLNLIVFLHILAIYISYLANGLNILFVFSYYKPEIINRNKFRLYFLIIYGGICLSIFFIPNLVSIRFLEDGTQLYPEWSLILLIINLIVLISTIILLTWMLKQVFKGVSNKKYKYKVKIFSLGFLILYWECLEISFENYLYYRVSPDEKSIFYVMIYSILILMIVVNLIYFKIKKD